MLRKALDELNLVQTVKALEPRDQRACCIAIGICIGELLTIAFVQWGIPAWKALLTGGI